MTDTREALIIANDTFGDLGLRQLVAPPRDAQALAHVLGDPAIGGFAVRTVSNELSYIVAQAIEAFFSDRRGDDLLLLYFSSHGIKDDDGQLYFATRDTQRNRLRTTAVPASLVNEVMLTSRSRRQVLILDCCYSGAFARGLRPKGASVMGTAERFSGRGRIVLTASDAMQYSFEGEAIAGHGVHSIFTHTLVSGLETGEADEDHDGYISLDELYEYTYERVVAETTQQKPGKWTFGVQGDLIIARNVGVLSAADSLPPMLREAIASSVIESRIKAIPDLTQMLGSNDRELAQAASAALRRLATDDSRRVAEAAHSALDKADASDTILRAAERRRSERAVMQTDTPSTRIEDAAGRAPTSTITLVQSPRGALLQTLLTASVVLVLLLAAVGFVTTITLDVALGRAAGFDEQSPLGYVGMGAKALFPTVEYVTIAFVVYFVAYSIIGFLSSLLILLRPVRAWTDNLHAMVSRWLRRARLDGVDAQLRMLSAAGFVSLAGIVWNFQALIHAFGADADRAPAQDMEILASSHLGMHVLYGFLLDMVCMLLAVLLWLLWRRARRERHGLAITGVACVALELLFDILLIAMSWRVLHNSKFPTATYNGRSCFIIGEQSTQVLVHCPASMPPRNRAVSRTDPALSIEGPRGWVFDAYGVPAELRPR